MEDSLTERMTLPIRKSGRFWNQPLEIQSRKVGCAAEVFAIQSFSKIEDGPRRHRRKEPQGDYIAGRPFEFGSFALHCLAETQTVQTICRQVAFALQRIRFRIREQVLHHSQ